MGTNFYIMTNYKDARDKYFGWNYELTDTPDWGYRQHVAKTSCGWLPLFDGSGCFQSIRELMTIYESGDFILSDEYGNIYTWDEFDERVLKFNGGIKGITPREKINQDRNSPWFDKNMLEYKPVSHFDYAYGQYNDEYFTDSDGYEFSIRQFR